MLCGRAVARGLMASDRARGGGRGEARAARAILARCVHRQDLSQAQLYLPRIQTI
jgi:hypothetical protein